MRLLRNRKVIAAIIVTGIVFFLGSATQVLAAGRYTNNELDVKLENGRNSAINWDSGCYNYLSAERNNAPLLRNIINGLGNGNASYREKTWLSTAGMPNTTNPVYLPRGATSVDLQINSVMFVCGTLVENDRWPGAVTNVPNQPGANNILGDVARWAHRTGGQIDRQPNNIGSVNMKPAKVDTRTRVDAINDNNNPLGYINGISYPEYFRIDRDDNSRLWFMNNNGNEFIRLRYNFYSGIRNGDRIDFTMRYRNIDGFHGRAGNPSRVETCASPGGPTIYQPPTPFNFDDCRVYDDNLRINFEVYEDWTVSGSTGLNNYTPYPTQTITFNHNVNVAGSTLSRAIGWRTERNINGGGWAVVNNGSLGERWAGSYNVANNPYNIPLGTPYGTRICERVVYSPPAWNVGGEGASSEQCAVVTYYDLDPNSNVNVSTASVEDTITMSSGFSVNNVGNINSPNPTSVSVKQIVIQRGATPGVAIESGDITNPPTGDWCDSIRAPGVTCGTYSNPAPRVFPPGRTDVSDVTDYVVPVVPAGTRICFMLAVDPVASWGWRHRWSQATCILILDKPYVKVYSGDALAGAGFNQPALPCTPTPGQIKAFNKGSARGYAGSGAQIGVLASSAIDQFVSANRRTNSPVSPNTGAWTPTGLTLANTPPGPNNYGGGYGAGGYCVADYWQGASVTGADVRAAGANVGPADFPGTGTKKIFVDGNVYVSGNIIYSGSGTWSLDTIPSFWLVARGGNIYIAPTVTQLEGVYVAIPFNGNGGKIFTCSNGNPAAPGSPSDAQMTSTAPGGCGNSQLRVNGAFIADQVKLLRTYRTLHFSTPQETSAATSASEIFTYTPEIWLSMPPADLGTTAPDYDAITSLPPIL